jgi:IclR family KDG regulon transcriptional repressor
MEIMSSAEKTLNILKRFSEPPFEFGVSELADEFGIAKSGMYKLLKAMVETGFIVQNLQTRKYSLGPAAFVIGAVFRKQAGITEVAKNVMEGLAQVTQYSIVLCFREGDHVLLAHKVKGEKDDSYLGWEGMKYPIHAGVVGKVLISYLPDDELRALLYSRTFERFTPNTPTDPEELFAQCLRIREQGYMVSIHGEHLPEIFAIGVPVRDIRNDSIWASLTLVGPRRAYSEEKCNYWIGLLLGGAREISDKLGFRR